ncbi:hypothetical protein NDA14_006705 [Ustilago hordei]|nr:hypothetical protein NDA10_004012 [Ustilago hordei]KAJ1603447.1 hypothetical protein NDA14_006705 [Ustilago hordei]UTT94585.1 hypothetical protein NDA17_005865 [Ustilago hordei]
MFHIQELVLHLGLLMELLQSQCTDSSLKRLCNELDTNAKGCWPFNNGVFSLNTDNMLCKVEPDGIWHLCISMTMLSCVISLTHTGHLGAKATFDCFHTVAYAPQLLRHIEDYIRHCSQCQQTRMLRHCLYGVLQLLPAPDMPFTTISCDFIMHLPQVQTPFNLDLIDMVLVLTNTAMHHIYLLSGASTWSTECWSLCYADCLLPHIGWPLHIISDHDSCLTSQFWHSLNTWYGCELVFSTAHHKSDGKSEHAIQSVELILHGLCNAWSDDWATHLPLVELLLANHVNASMNAAPNDLLYSLQL